MELNIQDWQEFKLSDYFDVDGTKTTKLETLVDEYGPGNYPYVTTQATNNGVAGYYDCYTEDGNILVADSAVVGYVSYQPYNFSASDHVEKIIPKNYFNKYVAMFLATVLNKENYRYSYGRKFNQDNIRNTIIKLPAKHVSKNKYVPDWQYMEDYIKSLHHKPITTEIKDGCQKELNIDEWEEFKVSNLFDRIYKAKAHTKGEVVEVNRGIHFVSRTNCDNGIDINVEASEEYEGLEEGNCITIGDTTATCFYQNERFIAGDHMVVLRANWLNAKRGLFFRTLFALEGIRYCYGRAYRKDLIESTQLKLPIKRDNAGKPIIDNEHKYSYRGFIPDWQFMEDYINSLPYSDRI